MRGPATRAAWALAAAFAALGLSRPSSGATPDPWREVWGWGDDPLRGKYEELFDRPFPARSFDIFHRSHPFYEVQQFNRAFDLRAAGVTYRVDERPEAVELLVSWPGSAGSPLDVSIDQGLVKLRPAPPEAPASPYRFRSARAEELDVPVPGSAKAESAKVAREGDVVRVSFSRR